MIFLNVHLLAILPLLLFAVATAVRYTFYNNTRESTQDEYIRKRLKDDFLYSFIMECTVLATINGIIMAELSQNFGAGIAFLMGGLLLGLISLTLARNGHEDLTEYLLALLGMVFLYEFVYFITADSYARVLGATLIGWQLAVIWYFGFIAACVGLFIFYVWFTSRGEES